MGKNQHPNVQRSFIRNNVLGRLMFARGVFDTIVNGEPFSYTEKVLARSIAVSLRLLINVWDKHYVKKNFTSSGDPISRPVSGKNQELDNLHPSRSASLPG